MKIPFSWLQEYVDLDLAPRDLAARLTAAGLEVESLAVVDAACEGVVAGEILAVAPHPDADALRLCEVSNGRDLRRVVCGAANFGVGDKVALAEPGARLPGGRVAALTVRGVKSEGMLCAEDELGLSGDHAGLLLLPPETPAGTPLAEVLGPPETVLTLEITPNRPDCLSLLGVAREAAALTGGCLKWPELILPESVSAARAEVSVTVEDGADCPRYTARVLSGLAVAPAPFAARRRLALAGIRPINNLVDATNYVMLECGQPLHAFDLDLLAGDRLQVRRARAGERLATLDGVERPLTPDLLVIADARGPVAVAGVMGGGASGIRAATRRVLLESACFRPALVRRGSKQLGLATESSYRFERGVDAALAGWASRRAAALAVQWSGAAADPGLIDIHRPPAPRAPISFRFERARRLLGMEVPDAEMLAVFKVLGLEVLTGAGPACQVRPPTFRADLEHEADLIEEVARLHGLDHIPERAPSRGVSLADDRPARALMRCRADLAALGLVEIMNYSFVSAALLRHFAAGDDGRIIALPRPLSEEQAVLRPWLLPQMVETLGRNRARQVAQAALFEIGRVFFRDGANAEEERLAVGLMGPVGRGALDQRRPLREEEIFAWLRGVLEALGAAWRVPAGTAAGLNLAPGAPPPGFPARGFRDQGALVISLGGKPCGVVGLLADSLRREYRLLEPVAALELRLAPLLGKQETTPVIARPPAYPAVTRDMALLVDGRTRQADLAAVIKKNAPPELTTIRLFDTYTNDRLGKTRKSMAYSLTYRAADRTLTDAEVNALHAALKAAVRTELKVEIRES